MRIDYETIIAAQRAKMDLIHWISQEIDRSPRAKAMKGKAKRHAPKRETEGKSRRKPKKK